LPDPDKDLNTDPEFYEGVQAPEEAFRKNIPLFKT
jgi:hypothetical protein